MFSNRNDAERILQKIASMKIGDNSFPALNHDLYMLFLGLRGLANTEVSQGDIFSICCKMPSSENLASYFEATYRSMMADCKRKSSVFRAYAPVQIAYPGAVLPVELDLLGYRVSLIDHVEIKQRKNEALAPGGAMVPSLWKPIDESTLYLRYIVTAHHDGWASHDMLKIIDYFRGYLHIATAFGSHSLVMGPAKARAKVMQGPWVAIVDENNVWNTWGYSGDAVGSKVYQLNDAEWKRLIDDVRIVARDPKTELVRDVIRLYGRSYEYSDREAMFLSLWNVLERITLSDRFGGETKKIGLRVAAAYKSFSGPDREFVISRAMPAYSSMRNDIVHRGVSGVIDDEALGAFKAIVETMIQWLLSRCGAALTENELDEIYHLLLEGSAKAKARAAAMQIVASWPSQECADGEQSGRGSEGP
jgi:hypothetical protein